MQRSRFNSPPPEGGWPEFCQPVEEGGVSTHSRPKAAGESGAKVEVMKVVSTHSRPKAAGGLPGNAVVVAVSTHSRPKAAGPEQGQSPAERLFQLTAARRRLVGRILVIFFFQKFQLTAARRRLVNRFLTG